MPLLHVIAERRRLVRELPSSAGSARLVQTGSLPRGRRNPPSLGWRPETPRTPATLEQYAAAIGSRSTWRLEG